MKRYAIALMLAALSCTAMGAWQQVADDSDTVGYYDPDSVLRDTDGVTVSELNDFKRVATTVTDALFRSTTMQAVYDCASAQVRVVTVQPYSDQMGQGNALATMNVDGEWQPILAGTTRAEIFSIVCR